MITAPARVFLVEDEALIAMEIEDRLTRLGYQVCGSARRGEDAIDSILDQRPDLVLMDVRLAGEIDGIETASRLRSRADLPIVFLSAYSDDALIHRAMAAEPLGYLLKPFEERELHATIQMALAKHRLDRVLKAAKQQLEETVRERTARLEASEARFAAFARIGSDWLWETDDRGRFLYISTGLKSARPDIEMRLGRTRRETAWLDPENLERVAELERIMARRESFQNFLYRSRRSDGTPRWCMISGEPVSAPTGEFIGYRGIGRDVQEEIETRRSLESKTRILNAAFLATPDAISVTGPDQRALEWNDRIFEIFDIDRAEALAYGDPVYFGLLALARRGEYGPGVPEQIALERRQHVAAIMAESGSLQYERLLKNGRWIEARLTAIEGGGWVSLYRDITARKEAELALRESEARLKAAQRLARVGDWVADLVTGEISWSDSLYEIFGRDRRTYRPSLDAYFDEVVHPDDVAAVRSEQAAAMAGKGRRSVDHRFIRPDGTEGWIQLEGIVETAETGQPVRLKGIAQDITERKRAEIALRELNVSLERRVEERTRELAESERFSRGILDSVGAHVAVLAADGRILVTNAAWREFAAANDLDWRKASEGINYLDVCERATGEHADDARTIAVAIRDVSAGRRGEFHFEYPCHRPHQQCWFLCRVVPLTAGGPSQVVVSHHDVTAVHVAMERAAAGERTFASLAEVSPVGIFRTDANGGAADVNRRWCEITGLSSNEAYGEGWANALHPDDRQRVLDEWVAFAHGGRGFRSEYRFRHADGTTRWVVGEAMRIGGGTDRSSGYIGTITDITEQKQIELVLRALSTDLASLDGTAYFEAAAQQLATFLDAPMAFITRLDPARPGELNTVAAIEDGKAVPNFSYAVAGTPCAEVVRGRSIIVASGVQACYPDDRFLGVKGIEAYAGVPVLDQAGRVLGSVAVLGRKPFMEIAASETALKIFGVAMGAALTRERNRRQYEDLFEFAPRALVMMEQQGRIALANRQAERIFGWTRQEMIGRPIETLVPGSLREAMAAIRQGSGGDGSAHRMSTDRTEVQGLRKDGTLFPAEIDLAPVRTENGVLIAAAVEDITPRKAIETALATSRDNLEDALESIDRGVILYDKDDRIVIFNRHFVDHFPGQPDVIKVGARFEDVFRAAVDCGSILVPGSIGKEAFIAERVARHRRADGQVMSRKLGDGRILQVTEHAARNGGIIGIGADVTEQLRIEEQLRAAQRMEAIGQLTGGMAHDFNNYLGVIIGNLDLLKERKRGDPVTTRYVDAALDGALRGAELTQSLLAFSRRKQLDPRTIDLNPQVDAITKLLARTLGERIGIVVSLAPELWPVEVDAAQLDSCIVNVATNARDAMPNGGTLTIATRNEVLDGDYARLNAGVVPGEYALIEISDTGIGMSAATLEHVFEPFFTTKGPGHGTGLGLSMAYGFVKQSGGHIRIYSELGRGTTVRIYLPRAQSARIVEYAAPAAATLEGGSETVLVVEDNDQMRETAAAQLSSLGYRVIEAGDGDAALEILERRGGQVHLLFSDLVMPGALDGYALAQRAVERQPGIKVLLTSGFPGDALARIGADARGFRLIGKPYRKEDLARAVRQALTS